MDDAHVSAEDRFGGIVLQDAERPQDSYAHHEPWRTPLEDLERTVYEVARALSALRVSLETSSYSPGPQQTAPPSPPENKETNGGNGNLTKFEEVWERVNKREEEAAAPAEADEEAGPEEPEEEPADLERKDENFERVWRRLQREQGVEVGDETAAPTNLKDIWDKLQEDREQGGGPRIEAGDLLQEYRMTIEDRDGTPVDLVPVHRALLTFSTPDDVSLLTFSNGVPVLSIRTKGELDLDQLATTIATATAKECEVIQQDKGKLFLRLSTEESGV